MIDTIDIMPEANLGIAICKNGTPECNAVILCCEVDYVFHYYQLPKPIQLFRHMINSNNVGIVR